MVAQTGEFLKVAAVQGERIGEALSHRGREGKGKAAGARREDARPPNPARVQLPTAREVRQR